MPTTSKIDWESQLGRRLRLRDLHVFTTAVRLTSMAKAAKELGVSQPAVSEVIGGLEHALGVRLLDRTRRGVEPTSYGSALLKRSIAAFDELRQGIRDIEYLSDPTVGELRIGCPESIAAGFLQPIVARFSTSCPRVVLDVDTVNSASFAPKLRERTLDLMLTRGGWPLDRPALDEDFVLETLFNDSLVVAVGCSNPLARRRKLNWAELADQPWVLTDFNYRLVVEAFNAHGLKPPPVQMKTLSVHLRAHMAATRNCVTTIPRSVLLLHGEDLGLKALPVELPSRSWPIMAVTVRNRMLSPIVERFLDDARAVSRSLLGSTSGRR
jgi:DNA-binding transcriptional LysR family regulator